MALNQDPDSISLSLLDKRTAAFQRNSDLDKLLEELAACLEPVEDEIEKQFDAPLMPPLLLVGNPRSGTSVFMQFLKICDSFAVPSNLLSRFYYAPYLGAKIQDLLLNPKYQFRDELLTDADTADLSSEVGKTRGPLSPGEFLHFWRRFTPSYDIEYLDADRAALVDIDGLRRGVAAIEAVYGKPFAAKAVMLQYNIDLLKQAFPDCLVVYMRRKPIYIMQSIMLAREKYYGDRNLWWSVKPPEYDQIKDLDCFHQVAGQVYYTERSIQAALESVPEENQLIVDYQTFCDSPVCVAETIVGKYKAMGCEISIDVPLPRQLESRNTLRIRATDIERLEAAYQSFSR